MRFLRKKILILGCILAATTIKSRDKEPMGTAHNGTNLIIFSYNRPAQLYALLESIEKHLTGISSTTVICRASSDRYRRAYGLVEQKFSTTNFWFQGQIPSQDFKTLTMKALQENAAKYVCFAVDDIIVKKKADLEYYTNILDHSGAYGFYLRLGKHLNYCYPMSADQALPPLRDLGHELVAFVFSTGTHDWRYPNTVDMTIYRKTDVCPVFQSLNFTNPNELEGKWAALANKVDDRIGLCCAESVIVNIPLNIVNSSGNRNMNIMSPETLLDLFEKGYKIDITPLYGIKNRSCHIEFNMTLIQHL